MGGRKPAGVLASRSPRHRERSLHARAARHTRMHTTAEAPHCRRDDAVKLGRVVTSSASPLSPHVLEETSFQGEGTLLLFRSVTGQPGWYQYSCGWGGATVAAPPARGKLTLREGWRGLTPACPAACSPPRPPLCLRRRVTAIINACAAVAVVVCVAALDSQPRSRRRCGGRLTAVARPSSAPSADHRATHSSPTKRGDGRRRASRRRTQPLR